MMECNYENKKIGKISKVKEILEIHCELGLDKDKNRVACWLGDVIPKRKRILKLEKVRTYLKNKDALILPFFAFDNVNTSKEEENTLEIKSSIFGFGNNRFYIENGDTFVAEFNCNEYEYSLTMEIKALLIDK
jgi:hypothetical protein